MIHPIDHDLAPGLISCGVAVICAITGEPESVVTPLVAEDLKGYSLHWDPIIRECLRSGYRLVFLGNDYKPQIKDIKQCCLCVVDKTTGAEAGHYVVVEDGMLADSGNRTPTPIASTRFAEQTAFWCWFITK